MIFLLFFFLGQGALASFSIGTSFSAKLTLQQWIFLSMESYSILEIFNTSPLSTK